MTLFNKKYVTKAIENKETKDNQLDDIASTLSTFDLMIINMSNKLALSKVILFK